MYKSKLSKLLEKMVNGERPPCWAGDCFGKSSEYCKNKECWMGYFRKILNS